MTEEDDFDYYKQAIVFTQYHEHIKVAKTDKSEQIQSKLLDLFYSNHALFKLEQEKVAKLVQNVPELHELVPQPALLLQKLQQPADTSFLKRTPLGPALFGVNKSLYCQYTANIPHFSPLQSKISNLALISSKFIQPRLSFDFKNLEQKLKLQMKNVLVDLSIAQNKFSEVHCTNLCSSFPNYFMMKVYDLVQKPLMSILTNFGLRKEMQSPFFQNCVVLNNELKVYQFLYKHVIQLQDTRYVDKNIENMIFASAKFIATNALCGFPAFIGQNPTEDVRKAFEEIQQYKAVTKTLCSKNDQVDQREIGILRQRMRNW
ncbi:Hypothetical_protein [Hexamita inflata]|uniref:Hypothetical_protein n=1 Tax=Hexamita inflata TaxID=28002 RepID=A0AA86TI65_9EUKA|nr:Hypothetical protein HINF_LOCUS5596 [Hexamita inflata]